MNLARIESPPSLPRDIVRGLRDRDASIREGDLTRFAPLFSHVLPPRKRRPGLSIRDASFRGTAEQMFAAALGEVSPQASYFPRLASETVRLSFFEDRSDQTRVASLKPPLSPDCRGIPRRGTRGQEQGHEDSRVLRKRFMTPLSSRRQSR